MAKWLDGRVSGLKQWTESLYSLSVDAEIADFEAGQFARLALEIDGEQVARPFSLVNAPDERPLDFYFIEVPGGTLSPRLANLQEGDPIQVSAKANGLMTLKHVPDSAKNLFLISTGTGIGPFLSILKTPEVWANFEQVTLVHAVRFQNELTYQETIQSARDQHPDQFSYIAIVSREDAENALSGRIPAAIDNGQLEELAGTPINSDAHVMLCGNPDMVQDTTELLETRDLRRHSRKEPGHITIEKYW